jgi:hypothetical protein
MVHNIYEGPHIGLYDYDVFEKWMRKLEEEKITEHIITESIDFRRRGSQVWHFLEQGVTLHYKYLSVSRKPVKIDLYGQPDNIGEVERIVLEKAGKFFKTS